MFVVGTGRGLSRGDRRPRKITATLAQLWQLVDVVQYTDFLLHTAITCLRQKLFKIGNNTQNKLQYF